LAISSACRHAWLMRAINIVGLRMIVTNSIAFMTQFSQYVFLLLWKRLV